MRKTILSYGIFVCISILILLVSCKKENNGGAEDNQHPFSIELVDGYSKDFCYVVLHSLDGKEVIDYKKVVGDGIADFGYLNENKVTVTMVIFDTTETEIGTEYEVILSTDIESPAGKWIFRSYPSQKVNETYAQIEVNYPNDNFEYLLISASNSGGRYRFTKNVPEEQYTYLTTLTDAAPGDKLSFYAAVYTQDGGYCNWEFNQDVFINAVNEYNIDLNKPLAIKQINVSQPLYRFVINGLYKPRDFKSFFRMFNHYNTQNQTNHINAKYPSDIQISEYLLWCNGMTGDGSFFYSTFVNGPDNMPGSIAIPTQTVSAHYNAQTDEVDNIQVNGTADAVGASWRYRNWGELYESINWYVYSENDISSIKRPVLPQVILNILGEDLDQLEISSVFISDYDLTSSHADIITRFFIEDMPIFERYNTGFSYYFNFSKYKHKSEPQTQWNRYDFIIE